jgi:hypothetical protein
VGQTEDNTLISVKATREGLVGQKTATGYLIEKDTPFVALPSDAALRQWVLVRNPRTGKQIKALVLDIGPWNIHDHRYVFQEATMDWSLKEIPTIRPQAESGTDKFGRTTNHAGIDLSERVWLELGMVGNDTVDWAFV